MAALTNTILDAGLDILDTNGTRLDITSQEATTYAEATSTYTLGNTTSLSIAAPVDGDTSGRKVVVGAVSGGSVTGTGTATHWAITNGTDTLYATGSLAASQAVTASNTFDLAAFDIEIQDPA